MEKDPFNLVVCGVGGQGNVLASRLVGGILVEQGYKVTIGETYGASQRGGSVMSHVRISKTQQYGPLMHWAWGHAALTRLGFFRSPKMRFPFRSLSGPAVEEVASFLRRKGVL